MRVKVQRGLDTSVPQLLLRDLGGYADIVQDASVYVAKLMPVTRSSPAAFAAGLSTRSKRLLSRCGPPNGLGRVSLLHSN